MKRMDTVMEAGAESHRDGDSNTGSTSKSVGVE